MRRIAVLLASLSLLAAAGTAAAVPVPPIPRIPGQWSHVDINKKVKGIPHTLSLDRGRIVQVSPTQLTLRASDGSLPVVPLDGQTIVQFRGRQTGVFVLTRKMEVETMRIDGGPAVRVRVISR